MNTVKLIHLAAAALSIGGFVLRAHWRWSGSPHLTHRLTRIFPHVNDTLLLGAGVWLAANIGQYPFVHGWLTAKVVAIVIYIGLGTMVIKRGGNRGVFWPAFAGAILTIAYIVAVAFTRQPFPGIA